MSTIRLHQTTTLTPDQYVASLTDFGPGRSKLFGNSAQHRGHLAVAQRDLAEVWQEHGRDTMPHTAKTQPATFFEAPNECAIYLLRSLLRQTCMLGQRHNRRNRSKNNRITAFLGEVKQGPQFLWGGWRRIGMV